MIDPRSLLPRPHNRPPDDALRAGAGSHVGARPQELLHKIPRLIARLTKFRLRVYMLDPGEARLSIAYSSDIRMNSPVPCGWKVGPWSGGRRGGRRAAGPCTTTCTADQRSSRCSGSNAELLVPVCRKCRVIGALNLLSDTPGQVHGNRRGNPPSVRGARRRRHRERQALREGAGAHSTLQTLSEVAREFGSILNLEELLTRIANLTRRSRLPNLRHPV